MKSVGEAMAFGRTFKEAFQKAIRSLEQSRYGLGSDGKDEFDIDAMDDEEKAHTFTTVRERLGVRRSDMIFSIRHAFKLGMTTEEIFEITKIDPWFLNQMEQIVRREMELRSAAKAHTHKSALAAEMAV
jgi:carbamoyl-phosphate synthase large subunit